MTRYLAILATTAGLALGAAGPAAAEGDPAAGKKVYNQCMACHSLKEGQHRVGPSLHGIFGRTAGTIDGFARYSNALKESDIVWDEETLKAYLKDPKGYIPGNQMPFAGIKDEEKLNDLVAYMKEATQ